MALQPLLGTAGICYGMNGDGLPPPSEVVKICQQKNIKKVRLYSPNQEALNALRNSKIDVMLGVLNTELESLSDPANATKWVHDHVTNNDKVIKYIVVGNEVNPNDATHLLTAMKSLGDAISNANLKDKIAVSTAILGAGVLQPFNRPSAAIFKPEFAQLIKGIIEFLCTQTKPVLLVNVHPYLVYNDQQNISLDYALFTATKPIVPDGEYGYYNLFDAIIDAVYTALIQIDTNADSLKIVASETGWPSADGKNTNETQASIYVGNLVKHVKSGTPRRPGKPIETYIKAMFDENKNQDPKFNRHWGVFLPNGDPKYPLPPTQSA